MLSNQNQSGRALFIGLGPGLELFLTQDRHSEIDAYDVSINENLPNQFPRAAFHATYYTGQNPAYYDCIYLIEILEHLSDPFDLLHICAQSLRAGGQIMLTTATDIPQFDHLYNLPDDHSDFEKKAFQTNSHRLEQRLASLGMLRRLSDACAYVQNPLARGQS